MAVDPKRIWPVALLALAAGFLIARFGWRGAAAPDAIPVIVQQLKTHAIIEHERQIAVWYKACPEVIGINPEIFVAWPGKLSYELDLSEVSISRDGEALVVKAPAIRADEPSVPTDFIDYLSKQPWLSLVNDQALVNAEVARATPIARYLSAHFQKRDPTLVLDMKSELGELVERLAGALGVKYSEVRVEIAEAQVQFPKPPKLELCAGSTASVNGVPFAKVEDGQTVPFAFDAAKAAGKLVAKGVIAGVGKRD